MGSAASSSCVYLDPAQSAAALGCGVAGVVLAPTALALYYKRYNNLAGMLAILALSGAFLGVLLGSMGHSCTYGMTARTVNLLDGSQNSNLSLAGIVLGSVALLAFLGIFIASMWMEIQEPKEDLRRGARASTSTLSQKSFP